MIALIDYDIGNLRSARRALEKVGAEVVMASRPEQIAQADAAVLPGVGAFRDCIGSLRERNLEQAVKDFALSGKPFLGICVGLQMLFETGHENGQYQGLGLFKGDVRLLKSADYKIPQIGWNTVSIKQKDCPLFKGIADQSYFYFVHSYAVDPGQESIIAGETFYGQPYPSMICQGNIFATQFHPEKSQKTGLRLLENFVQLSKK